MHILIDIFVFGLVFAIPVYFLWNWVGVIVGLPIITYWQAWGIYCLASMLFKGHSTKGHSTDSRD